MSPGPGPRVGQGLLLNPSGGTSPGPPSWLLAASGHHGGPLAGGGPVSCVLTLSPLGVHLRLRRTGFLQATGTVGSEPPSSSVTLPWRITSSVTLFLRFWEFGLRHMNVSQGDRIQPITGAKTTLEREKPAAGSSESNHDCTRPSPQQTAWTLPNSLAQKA